MTKTRINTENKYPSDTLAIQSQLQMKPLHQMKIESKEDEIDGIVDMVEKRNTEIQHIAKDALLIDEMFKDLSQLIEGQQPALNQVQKTLRGAKKHIENANVHLDESNKSSRCVIS